MFLWLQEYENIEVCPKILFQIELSKGEKDRDFGFAVEAELAEDTEQEDELCVFISDVIKGGLAHRKGQQPNSSYFRTHQTIVKYVLCMKSSENGSDCFSVH